MLNNHQVIQAANVAADVSYKILIESKQGSSAPRDREQVILIMKVLNEMVEACTKPSNFSEVLSIALKK